VCWLVSRPIHGLEVCKLRHTVPVEVGTVAVDGGQLSALASREGCSSRIKLTGADHRQDHDHPDASCACQHDPYRPRRGHGCLRETKSVTTSSQIYGRFAPLLPSSMADGWYLIIPASALLCVRTPAVTRNYFPPLSEPSIRRRPIIWSSGAKSSLGETRVRHTASVSC
jgi:hypothetical protein